MSNLIELAERCEAATGPDRELDEAVDKAAFPHEWNGEFFDQSRHDLPSYTASLDAAMTLVPEGCFAMVMNAREDGRGKPVVGGGGTADVFPVPMTKESEPSSAATPALALCAAALKARAAS